MKAHRVSMVVSGTGEAKRIEVDKQRWQIIIPWFSDLVYLSGSKSALKTCFRCCSNLLLGSKPSLNNKISDICELIELLCASRAGTCSRRPGQSLWRRLRWRGTLHVWTAVHFLGPENGPKNGAALLNFIIRPLRKWLWFWGRPCRFLSSFCPEVPVEKTLAWFGPYTF